MSEQFQILIDKLSLSEGVWTSPIYCKGITASNGPIVLHDICEHLGRHSQAVFSYLHPDSGFAFDPDHFKGLEKRKELMAYITEACRKAGFEVFVDHRLSKNRKSKYVVGTLVFRCRHNQQLSEKDASISGTPTKRKRKTKHTFKSKDSDDICPFRFKVTCSADDNLWYLHYRELDEYDVQRGMTCACHFGHVKMDTTHIPIKLSEMMEKQRPLIDACVKAKLNATQMAEVCRADIGENQGYISINKCEYIKSTFDDIAVMCKSMDNNMSSAEKVIKMMDYMIESGKDLDYRVLIHSKEHGINIRNPKGRPRKFDGDVLSIDTVRKAMSIHEDKDVLLAIAWMTGEEKELITRFPEVISADVTERTNLEKRPLYLFCGLDGNRKIFPALHCFMPNSTTEIYEWIYEYAFLDMAGANVVERNEVFLTDGETAMYESLDNLKGTSSPWASTTLFRCIFHIFYQVWDKTIGGKDRDDSEKSAMKSVKDMIVNMIYSIQHEYQLEEAMHDFEKKLEDNKALLPNTYFCIHSLWYGMKAYRVKWARCYKRNTRDLEVTATSMSESLNSSLKRKCGKNSLPNSIFANATSKVMNHSDYLCDKREHSLARSIQCHTGTLKVSETSKFLTEYAEAKGEEIFERRKEYDVLRYSETEWLVSHKSNRPYLISQKKDSSNHDPFCKPSYNNTHHVSLCKETKTFSCSCNGPVRVGMPCSHIGAVANQKHPSMFSVRWYKIYCSLTYGCDQKVLSAFMNLAEHQRKHPGGVDATVCFRELVEEFDGVSLPDVEHPHLVAKQMMLAYCMHLKKRGVQKRTKLDWESMQGIQNDALLSLRDFVLKGIGINTEEIEEICMETESFDSEDHLITESPKRVSVTEDMKRYNKMLERTKRIFKLCEGRNDVYTKMMSMMDEMEVEAMKLIMSKDEVVQNEVNVNSGATMVSSNAPVECTPQRGRFKSAHERRSG